MNKKIDTLYIYLLGIVLLLTSVGCNSRLNTPEEKSEYRQESEAFFEKISKDKSYKELKHLNHPQPIYYKELSPNSATEEEKTKYPFQNSRVSVKLSGKLYNGVPFQESEKMSLIIFDLDAKGRPAAGVVEGLRYALLNMNVGDHWEVVIPHQLGYGHYKRGAVEPYSTLIFDVTLLKVIEQ